MISMNETTSNRRIFPDASPLIGRIHWAVVFVAMPTVGVLGIIGNSLSAITIYRLGFKKSTNILLFALAISDILFMIGANGPPRLMYEFGRGGLWYPEQEASVLYYSYQIFDYLNWTAGPMSIGLPVLITAERFVAVFFPLKFHSIVTRRRTLVAVAVLALLTYLPQIYIRLWLRFDYVFDPVYNASVGLSVRTRLYHDQQQLAMVLVHFYAGVGYFVFIVGSGTIAIIIRISLAAAQRRRMTSVTVEKTTNPDSNINARSQRVAGKLGATSRTTKTLLTLCIFYTISCMFIVMPTFLPHLCVYPLFTPDANFRSMEVFMYHLIDLDLCLNASCNFVIYVAINKNFRDAFFESVGKRKK
ncbi:hypothetical protein RRG08_000966 [Elysia crispata]|uniref:G-protein coupled receptors family 1 profile domain-containing protein n=1 Tax=Elysia crispata TaxID=231223 RepID=A0AAE1AGP9_9GAST|nr:hypothetical protein RRG08_000966 [Elysia crispata]